MRGRVPPTRIPRLRDADRVTRDPRIELATRTEITGLVGDRRLEAVQVTDRDTGASRTIPSEALFVFIGATPCTDWLADAVRSDSIKWLPRRIVTRRPSTARILNGP